MSLIRPFARLRGRSCS